MSNSPEPHGKDISAHILVLDDERGVRDMVSLCLKKAGYAVTTAESAEEARRFLETENFAAIITDIMMPGEDGISFLMKVHAKTPEIPVIIMTAYAQLKIAVNAIKHGAFDFIHKPFDFSYLCTVVEKAVKYSMMLQREKQYTQELEISVDNRTAELSEALDQLDKTQKALMQALNEKRAFMATISHEMRTPMNGIIGGLDLLSEAGLNGMQESYLLLVRKAADNMQELVERMLSFSENAGRGGVANHKPVNLAQLVSTVIDKHRAEFEKKLLAIQSTVTQTNVRCDDEQIVRLLDILLNNACKFTEIGGATIEAEVIVDEDRQALLRLAVRDTGIGIPQDKLDMIFEPFTQVDCSSTRRFGGAGLGLCIARNIVSILRGNVQVESAPGHGSYFCCEIPCEIVTTGEII